MAKSDSELLLSEIAKKLRTLQCICENTANTGGAIVKDYQPLDCDGAPVGAPIDVMATIAVAKQDVAICNVTELAEAIAIGGDEYDIPTVESATTDWALSDNNDIAKVHSISISVISSTSTDTVNLTIDGGTPATLPVGFTYNATASTVFNVDFVVDTFVGSPTVIITTTQKV